MRSGSGRSPLAMTESAFFLALIGDLDKLGQSPSRHE